jgi:Isochorismatase family
MQVGLRRLDGFMPEPQRDHGAGCATEAVMLRAALSALERGYRVRVPVDGRGGLSARSTENAALRQIEAAGGASILARCARLLGLPMLHSVVPHTGRHGGHERHDGGRPMPETIRFAASPRILEALPRPPSCARPS